MKAGRPSFKFELGWLLREGFMEMIKDIWTNEIKVVHLLNVGMLKLGNFASILEDGRKMLGVKIRKRKVKL